MVFPHLYSLYRHYHWNHRATTNEKKIKKEEILTILHAFKFLIILVAKFINTHKRCPDIVYFSLPSSIKQNPVSRSIKSWWRQMSCKTSWLKIRDRKIRQNIDNHFVHQIRSWTNSFRTKDNRENKIWIEGDVMICTKYWSYKMSVWILKLKTDPITPISSIFIISTIKRRLLFHQFIISTIRMKSSFDNACLADFFFPHIFIF